MNARAIIIFSDIVVYVYRFSYSCTCFLRFWGDSLLLEFRVESFFSIRNMGQKGASLDVI